MNDGAEDLLRDGWLMWCCLQRSFADGTLLPDVDCPSLALGDIVPVKPDGGCAGWRATFSIDIGSCCG